MICIAICLTAQGLCMHMVYMIMCLAKLSIIYGRCDILYLATLVILYIKGS